MCYVVLRIWEWSTLTVYTHLYNSVQGDDVARVLQTDRLVRSQATVASLRRLPKKYMYNIRQECTCACIPCAWRGHQWVHILQQNTLCMHPSIVLHYGLGQFSHQKLVLRGCIMRFIVETVYWYSDKPICKWVETYSSSLKCSHLWVWGRIRKNLQ